MRGLTRAGVVAIAFCLLVSTAMLAACASHPQQVASPSGVSRLAVVYRDEMGDSFKLARAEVRIDGTSVWSCGDGEKALDATEPFLVFDGPVIQGARHVGVKLELRGSGAGIFSYLKGYRFAVQSEEEVQVRADPLLVEAVSYEQGGQTTPLEDRPAVRYRVYSVAGSTLPTRTACPTDQ
jgi:hypothetical protein